MTLRAPTTTTLLRRLVAAPVVLLLLLVAAVAATPAQARDLRASIRGIVLDAATGKGVPGTTVLVMEQTCPWGCGPGAATTWEPIAKAMTAKTGAYTVALPRAGTFRVFFLPADREKHAMEAYPDAALPLMGDDVITRYGKATTNISVKLDPAKRIEGHVWAAESRWDEFGERIDESRYLGLEGIPVHVAFQSGARIEMFLENPDTTPDAEPVGIGVTDANGFYSVSGFKEYPFFIWANFALPYAYLPPADADRRDLIVDDGSDDFPAGIKTMDAFLARTVEVNIRGRLVDEVGAGLAGLPITVWETDWTEREQSFQPTCTVTTDGNGYFGYPSASPDDVACLNLVEPLALLQFQGTQGLRPEFYDNRDQWGARQVRVSWGWTEDIGEWVLSQAPVDQG
ncbi:MAG TPA: hypothetical protein VLA55_00305 [Ornithinibacter sp.]|nr:hypothetical protein [Ornithinibacter sp.]